MSLKKPLLFKKKISVTDKVKVVIPSNLREEVMVDTELLAQAIQIKMPNVVGFTIEHAKLSLRKAGLNNYVLKSKEVVPKEGSVYAQEPKAGALIKLNQVVTLYINDHLTQ